jgi:HEAT repeat protein
LTTFDHAAYANALARAIALLRLDPAGGEEQKEAVRILLEFSVSHSATVRFYEGVLTVEDQEMPLTDQAFAFLASRLRLHAVVEMMVARGAEPPEIVALVRGLAGEGGQGRLKERLRDASSTRVMVIFEQAQVGLRRPQSVSQAFATAALDEAALAEWNRFLQSASQASADKQVDLGMTQAADPTTPPEPEPEPQPAEGELAPQDYYAEEAPAPLPEAEPAAVEPVAIEQEPPPPPPAARPPRPTLAITSPMGVALAYVMDTPYESDILTRLTPLERHIQTAMAQDRVPEAIDALKTLVDLEANAPDEQVRGSYSIILRRLLNRPALVEIAPYALDAKRAERATEVLRRGGDVTADYLVGYVASAPTVAERVAYLHVLRGIPRATDRVIAMLSRPELQVVRNVAEALGEVHVRESASFLARLMEHADERVRRVAMIAMARIGTAATVEPLRQILREGTPEQRALVVASIGGAHARALVGPLAALTESEKHQDVLREAAKALGRVGTPEAVQALSKLAQAGGRVLGRKPTPLRLAAVEGLRLAGSPEAAKALEGLVSDGDRAISEAARAALGNLSSPGPA